MIMAASSELLHHESSAKALLQVPGVIVRSPRSAKCERERVHNSRLFGTLSLLPSAVKSSTISVFPPLYVLHSLADESHYYPSSHASRLLRAPLIYPALQPRECRYAVL